jgi:hypothetical protein
VVIDGGDIVIDQLFSDQLMMMMSDDDLTVVTLMVMIANMKASVM